MKNRFCFLVVLALLLLSGCSPEGASADSDFFLWSDAYVAMEEGVPYTYSFTYYCEDPGAYLDPERVDGFYIPGLPSPEVLLSAGLILVHFVTLCLHATMGGWQFGNRYTIDALPALYFALMRLLREDRSDLPALTRPLCLWGLGVNLAGTVALMNHWI